MNLKRMLKGALVTAIALFSGFAAHAQNVFNIKGQLAKDKQGKIVLNYKRHGKTMADTAVVTNGAFSFKGEVSDPCYALLELNKPAQLNQENLSQYDFQNFFLEGATITVSGEQSIKTAKVSGGKSQADFAYLISTYKPLEEKMGVLRNQMAQYKKDMNDTAMQRVQKEFQPLTLTKNQIDSVFIATKTDSYVAFDLWRKKHRGTVDPAIMEPGLKHFTTHIQATEEGKILAERIAAAKKLNIGQPAPNFILKDTLGHDVSLASFKGKNVMLYFWTNHFMGFENFAFNLGRINRKLSNRNFVMVGVYYSNINAGTEQPEYWKSLLNKSGMQWNNVQDIGGLSFKDGAISPVAKAYSLEPTNLPIAYLIGTDGKILGRNLRMADKDLAQTIENLIK